MSGMLNRLEVVRSRVGELGAGEPHTRQTMLIHVVCPQPDELLTEDAVATRGQPTRQDRLKVRRSRGTDRSRVWLAGTQQWGPEERPGPVCTFMSKEETSRCIFFFFSSRRRHTRSDRDWSSDVCSSD